MSNTDNKSVMDILQKVDICLMATFNEAGEIHTRPMAILKRENFSQNPCVFFFIRNSSQVGQEIRLKDYVHLGYMDTDTNLYVTFKGKGEINEDENLKKELWSPMMKRWFPEGLDDPELSLIEVKLEEAQIWDSVSARVIDLSENNNQRPIPNEDRPSQQTSI
ncbi:MAG TPA: pyridoxamine 5'-phosphate oxidase family protein [Bacteriovoracaceae bacterium]|nr:pyridoxamine 5'-phosphate oxidase family protein [Bacteriovoracaceae bacterium]